MRAGKGTYTMTPATVSPFGGPPGTPSLWLDSPGYSGQNAPLEKSWEERSEPEACPLYYVIFVYDLVGHGGPIA
eukprot:5743593-Pyramimonas_sp.AAC.1